jgi:hypothetical protein
VNKSYIKREQLKRDISFWRRRVWMSESSGMYCRVLKLMSPFYFGPPTHLPLARFLTYRHPFPIGQPRPLGSCITSYPFALGLLIALMMEATRFSETSVDIDLRTRQYIPEDSELQIRLCCSVACDLLLHVQRAGGIGGNTCAVYVWNGNLFLATSFRIKNLQHLSSF